MERHRANPTCSSCHNIFEPMGTAMENFNAVGQWRTLSESGLPIDSAGALPDGTRFEGADGLRASLADSELFVVTLTEKMLTYALGRGLEHYDAPAVRSIVHDASRDDYRMTSLIQGVVESTPFQMRMTAVNP